MRFARLLICLAVLALMPPLRAALAAAPADPLVTFDYSQIFDGPCYAALNKPPETDLITSARDQLAAWHAEWDGVAPELLATTVKITGRPFKFHELRAAVFTCPAFVSTSFPLILNVRFLLGRMAKGTSAPHEFSQMLFHEVLHNYVSDRLNELPGRMTPTLAKYKDEAQAVRSHLYNVSIMFEVYHALGRDDEASQIKKRDMSLGAVAGMRGANDMARAEEIIEKEHSAALVKELFGPR